MLSTRARQLGSHCSKLHYTKSVPSRCLNDTPHFRPIRVNSTQKIAQIGRRWYSVELPKLDEKWRSRWLAQAAQRAKESTAEEDDTKMVIPMFPYPSGTLHLGHLRVYTIADVVARYKRLKGEKVVLPMGWDAFGLPAENAALERGIAPDTWTRSNIAKMKNQLEFMNADWSWQTVCCFISHDGLLVY